MQLTASSLEDIAAFFTSLSQRANQSQVGARTAKAGAVHRAEARVWAHAADMLRETQMHPLQMVFTSVTINWPAAGAAPEFTVNDLNLGPSRLSSVPRVISDEIARQGRGQPTSLVAVLSFFGEPRS